MLMRTNLLTCLVLVASLPAVAQKHSAQQATQAAAPDNGCGPIGCITSSTAGTSPVQGGSPVVIRSVSGPQASDPSAQSTQSASGQHAAAAAAPTDFERFVTDSLGHSLPRFGANLFANGGDSFAPPTNVAPPADYVLGSGDEVLVRTTGKVDIDARAVVDRNGQIFLPRIGTLTVAGLRLDQLTEFIRASIARQFIGFELSVSLGQLRSIQIFVLGQAHSPGVYTIDSLSTLVNALFLSGGPGPNGSLRDIQLKRAGRVLSHFDVYGFLLDGNKSADMRLLPGDIIYIPVLGPQIAVDGDVGTPAIYELDPKATVADVITVAGGLTPIAGTERAVLEHVVDRSRRTTEDIALDSRGLAIAVHGGDILRVLPISPKISDAVTLRGNVANPGRYAWHAGMRVSDLIPTRQTLLTRSYYSRQNALGVGSDTSAPPVASHDTEINWNYAVIERLDPTDLTTHPIAFALGDAIDHPDSAENKALEPSDVVVVYSQNDVALPLELQAKFVRIDGQVKAPGTYRVGQNETLRELVQRAGGLVPHAYLYAARLTRDSVRAQQDAELKSLIAQESQEVLSPANQRSVVGTAPPDLELRKAYIAQLSSIHPDGRVVLQLQPDAHAVEDVPEFALQDGDHFYVPTTPNTVDVIGSVYNQGTLRFLPGAKMREYLDAAGGATRDSDRRREFIIRADGTLVSRQAVAGLEKLKIFPGDAIAVPVKLRAGSSAVDLINLTSVLSTFALTAVAIKALQ